MDIDRVLSLFGGVKEEGDHYKAKCPVCQKAGHLYITPSGDTIKVYCQKCGAKANQIADALGISMAELLHGEDVKPLPTNQVHIEQRVHTYYNADGSVFGKKTIKKYDAGKKGAYWELYTATGWRKGLQRQTAPIYGADKLAAQPDAGMFVVEGEKDVDTLVSLDYLAVSLPNGASQKTWPTEYTAAFAERDVVIITDNDDPGTEYGQFVAEHINGAAASIKIVPAKVIWPDVQQKGDISDIIAALGADEALNRLQSAIFAAKLWVAPNFPPDAIDIFKELKFYSVPDLTDEDKLPPEFIVDGMIPTGMTFLSGAPKTRKSFLALQLAAAVANGVPFLGHNTTRCKVVYFDLEGSKSRISARVSRMGLDFTRDILITNQIDTKVSSGLENTIRALHKADNACRLFIVDTYGRARGTTRATGANAYDSDIQLLEPIQRTALEENIAIVFIHHDKKGASLVGDSFERLSGTMGISGSCDAVLNLICDGKRFDGKATLEFTPRDAKGGELHMNFNELSLEWIIDEAPQDIAGNPAVKFCIDNAPAPGKDCTFFSYKDVFANAYRITADNGGSIVRDALKKNRVQMLEQYGICVQLGAFRHGDRGIRIMR